MDAIENRIEEQLEALEMHFWLHETGDFEHDLRVFLKDLKENSEILVTLDRVESYIRLGAKIRYG